jgi:radical SAM superfamily enzyme YgiQ (UPF0313 family)
MHILLINPNQYHFPPVIPLGLEYLAGSLEQAGQQCTVLDLCFAHDPHQEILKAVRESKPDIAGISVRQIDTVLYRNNQFFLEQIRDYVGLIKKLGLGVILGGSGFSIMPREVLHFTGAEWGVAGPGEKALVKLLKTLQAGKTARPVMNGFHIPDGFSFPRKKAVDYKPYLEKEGIVGFRTQIGCTENCFFCVESRRKLIFHPPQQVGKEVAELKNLGYTDFHLCDSEFNQDLSHSLAVCRAIAEQAGKINWSLYLKPEPFSEELFSWLKKSGASSLTLSLDTPFLKGASLERLKTFFDLTSKFNLKVAVDLSVGAPGESIMETKAVIDFLAGQPVATVGVNSYYRVYPGTPLFRMVYKNRGFKKKLIDSKPDKQFLYPVFFNLFPERMIAEIIDGRSKFRIEGFDKATNYQRIKSSS